MDRVLATIRDVESQPTWVKEVLEAEVVEKYDDGTPATAQFTFTSPVGKDSYTLSYEHTADAMTWTWSRVGSRPVRTGHTRCAPSAMSRPR
jgi:hypothetical protein